MDAPKLEDVQQGLHWWGAVGAFAGGILATMGTRLGLRTREQRQECEALVSAIQDDGAQTREVLAGIRTDLKILLDRDDSHRGRT